LADGESDTIGKIGGASIMIVTEGEGTLKADGKDYKLSAGYILFVSQGTEIDMKASKALKAFTAFVE
jgi:mannose-6-phosphate isomerase